MGQVTKDGYIVGPVRESFFGVVHQLLPMSSGAIQSQDSVGIDGQANVQVERQAVVADSLEATIQFIVAPGQLLEDTEQYLSMYGTGLFPRVLASPLVVPRGSTFVMQANDRQTVAADCNIRFLSIGKKVYDQPYMNRRKYTLVRPYTLTANFVSSGVQQLNQISAAGGQSQGSVNVSSEWDFEIRKIVIVSDGPVTVQAMTSGKALGWFNVPCHSDLLGGTRITGSVIPAGAWPFVLTCPEYVPATGSIQINIADLSAAVQYPNRVKVGFVGNRLYPPGGLAMY